LEINFHMIIRLIRFTSFLFVSLFVVLTTIAQLPLENIKCSLEPQKPIDSFQMPVLAVGRKAWHISNSFGNRVTNKDILGLPAGIWQHTGDDFILGDIAGSQSQPVYAIGNGVVIFSTKSNKNPNAPRGGMVIIRHVAPTGSKFIVSQYEGAGGKYTEFETLEIFSYYLHLNPDEISVKQDDPVVKGKQIGSLYSFVDQKKQNLVYPPHLHLEIWSTCGKEGGKGTKIELNGYEQDGTLRNSLKNPVIDPDSFLTNVRFTQAPKQIRPYNVALGRRVWITTNGANDSCDYCEKEWADITDGRLDYSAKSGGQIKDGCVGWQNNGYRQLMEVKVTVDLGKDFNISKIRYNVGNVMRAETWNADYMISPFGRTTTNPGSGYSGKWTEHTGNLTASTVTITFQKTRTEWARDWLFIGEIEVIGTPVDDHPN